MTIVKLPIQTKKCGNYTIEYLLLGNKANKELLEQLEKLAEEAKGTAEQAQKNLK